MVFIVPVAEWERINAIVWNKQNYLLQEVKGILIDRNPTTDMQGSGPVVIAPFGDYKVEVVPSFIWNDTGVLINAHTKDGGSWKFSHPIAELADLNKVDADSGGMVRDLCKMLKAWKEFCNVEIRSVCLEILAIVFIREWTNKGKDYLYYDFMVRDFFGFMLRYVNGRGKPAGIDEWIDLGDCWKSRAESAYARACKASDYEKADDAYYAVEEWKKNFGYQFHHAQAETINYLAGLL